MSTSYNITTEVEKESSIPYPKDVMTNLNEWNIDSKDTILAITPHFEMGSNEVTNPLMAANLI
jgi:hypothetical protein